MLNNAHMIPSQVYLLQFHMCSSAGMLSVCWWHAQLPALSGLATAFSRRTDYTYYARLWKQDLIRGFLWEASLSSCRPSYYRAPSWSWASIDGEISTFQSREKAETYNPLIGNFRSQIRVSEKAAFGAMSEEVGFTLLVDLRSSKWRYTKTTTEALD